MATFSNEYEVFEYIMGENSINNEEGKLFIALSLLQCLNDGLKQKNRAHGLSRELHRNDFISFDRITPKGWSRQKTYCCVFVLFMMLEIKPGVTFHREKYFQYYTGKEHDWSDRTFYTEVFEKNNAEYIFQNPCFFLQDDILEFIEINNDFDTDENISKFKSIVDNHVDAFVSGEISQTYSLLSYEKQRDLIINKLSDFYNLAGPSFVIQDNIFKQYNDISLLHMVVLLWKLGYIFIHSLDSAYGRPVYDLEGKYLHEKENLGLRVSVTEKAISLFEGLFEVKNLIIDKVFDEEYKKISIIRKGNKLHLIEGERNFFGDETKFIDLKNKFPFSDIKASNHGSKTTKYKVTERIKLDE